LVIFFSNISSVYDSMEEYVITLSFYEKNIWKSIKNAVFISFYFD
jgi:hypothetical protein